MSTAGCPTCCCHVTDRRWRTHVRPRHERDQPAGPPHWWLDRPKRGKLVAGLVPMIPAPDGLPVAGRRARDAGPPSPQGELLHPAENDEPDEEA
ncbi:MAG: hypothetical protein ACRDO9_00630, partial [Gaiellales bacterium]